MSNNDKEIGSLAEQFLKSLKEKEEQRKGAEDLTTKRFQLLNEDKNKYDLFIELCKYLNYVPIDYLTIKEWFNRIELADFTLKSNIDSKYYELMCQILNTTSLYSNTMFKFENQSKSSNPNVSLVNGKYLFSCEEQVM